MNRRRLRVLPVLLVILALAACGQSGPGPSGAAPASPASPPPSPSASPPPAPSMPAAADATPAMSPALTATPGSAGGVATVEHCGASADYQLDYALPGMEAAEVTCDIRYKQIEGLEATLDVYLPPGTDTAARLPVVVFVHGNGTTDPVQPVREHWKRDGYTNGLIATASGWAGITFDYRGYTPGNPVGLEGAQQDVLDLLAYLDDHADELNLDPARICLWATSGGGLPAAWAAMRGEPRPRCVVTFSVRLDLGVGSEPAARDPAALIHADQPPFFIARGKVDAYAYQGSMRFVERALEVGAEIVVEDHPGGHNFYQYADAESHRIVEAALDFLRTHLAGP